MRSDEISLDETLSRALVEIAHASIRHGLRAAGPPAPESDAHPPALRVPRASFVTLRHGEALRGCVGTLEAIRPLVEDVSHNAHAAAFRDPRFEPLKPDELVDLRVHISVLTPPEPLAVVSEAELVAELEPGADGVIVADGERRGTFLPAVWEQLPEPEAFLRHLRHKAGLPADHWSPTIRWWRYRTVHIE